VPAVSPRCATPRLVTWGRGTGVRWACPPLGRLPERLFFVDADRADRAVGELCTGVFVRGALLGFTSPAGVVGCGVPSLCAVPF